MPPDSAEDAARAMRGVLSHSPDAREGDPSGPGAARIASYSEQPRANGSTKVRLRSRASSGSGHSMGINPLFPPAEESLSLMNRPFYGDTLRCAATAHR